MFLLVIPNVSKNIVQAVELVRAILSSRVTVGVNGCPWRFGNGTKGLEQVGVFAIIILVVFSSNFRNRQGHELVLVFGQELFVEELKVHARANDENEGDSIMHEVPSKETKRERDTS